MGLTGCSLILKTENKIHREGTSFTQKYGSLKLKKAVIESVDFSYADISYSWWQECQVSNCLFEGTKARELHVYATDFINCTFRKVNFAYSDLNRNIGKQSGSYKSVDFIECNLKECVLSFPEIEGCAFKDCDINATNFDGSRFKNCTFAGELSSAWFNGFSITAQRSFFGIFNRVEPRNYPNLMEGVDFSKARMDDILFQYGIDLANCRFPDDPRYFVVYDLDVLYPKVIEEVEINWPGEDRRIALSWIENLYYNKNKRGMKLDLINSGCRTKYFSEDLYNKFFNLLKRVNAEVQAK
ncbi:MAG: pentapeptide repeat-containing protein [Bacteroidota bacterium]